MVVKKDMILRQIGNDTILVPVGNALKDHNGLFMLTESACFLWQQLPECNSVHELARKLYDEYEVSQEQALADTKEFIDKLAELDIIDKL
ncbi:MAG: PqqD family protein [Acutalibacteraceae bacterium]|nr:PqqD family protein [Acutalibacteraceae bacterium]